MEYRYIDFGNFTIDLFQKHLLHRNVVIRRPNGQPLPSKAVRILVRIIDKRPAVVRGEDLADILDQRTAPADRKADLGRYIYLLRRSARPEDLGQYLQTMDKRRDQPYGGGYFFVGEVRFRSDDTARSERDGTLQVDSDTQVKQGLHAWSKIRFPSVYKFLAGYYRRKAVPMFTYPCSRAEVPLYVRPSWRTLTEQNLVMEFNPIEREVNLTEPEQQFLKLHARIREILGRGKLWNGRVFRLVALDVSEHALRLRFEAGRFFNSLAHQDFLENEARLALTSRLTNEADASDCLPVRDAVASSAKAIEQFCKHHVAGVGISNLILFRSGKETYRPAVRSRGNLSLAAVDGIVDNISSGIFDISNADPRIDFEIKYKVFKEIYEELFGGKDVEKEIKQFNPDFFFDKPGIRELRPMLKDGRAFFRITGFCIDLMRVAPEITTVLVVRDPKYYTKYKNVFITNEEYQGGFTLEIPRNLGEVDAYLAERFPSDPADYSAGLGFDPTRWTLPGAFCFYQGLHKASQEGLL